MGFFDSIFDTGTSLFDSAVSGVENLFGGSPASTVQDFGSFGSGGLPAGYGLLSESGASTVPAIYSNTQLAPMIAGGALVARGLAARFPQLMARLNASGISRSKAYSVLKRYGPAALTGAGFAALEVSQLAVAGPGRRRMNICNARALRRASRRIEGFHKFYKRTCGMPTYSRRRRKC